MAEASGGAAVAKLLSEYGVEYMFGMPGGQTLPIYDGLYDLKKTRHILVHDEKCGVFMADAYARFSFKPGVCDATVGPGTTNLVSGVAEAWGNSIPIVVITSDIDSRDAQRGVSQECDQLAVLRPFTKASIKVEQIHKLPELTRKAFRIAVTGRPGPVHLDFPQEVLQGKRDFDDLYAENDCGRFPARRTQPEDSRVIEAVRLIEKSERPVIVAGGGAILSQAWDEVTELAELLGAPVSTTITGKGAIPETHPLSTGIMGRQGYREPADIAVEEADVLIAVGCKFAQIATDNWNLIKPATKIIQIDIDPAEIGRVYSTAVSMTADAKLGLKSLISALKTYFRKKSNQDTEWMRRISTSKKEWKDQNTPFMTSDAIPIKPQRIFKEIREVLGQEGILVSDTSFTGAFAAAYFDVVRSGRTFYQQRGMAGIGGGLPAAIGTKLAVGNKLVVGIGGDGSFGYHVSELETAKRYDLPIVYVVSNNNSLGWMKYSQEKYHSKKIISSEFSKIDFAKVSESYGCFGRAVERPSEIKPALEEAVSSGIPAVIDVQVDLYTVPPIGRKSEYSV